MEDGTSQHDHKVPIAPVAKASPLDPFDEQKDSCAMSTITESALKVQTPDANFDSFVNYYLPRQIQDFGSKAVSSTPGDVDSHDYLQSSLGLCYLQPQAARQAILTAVEQSSASINDSPASNEEGQGLKFANRHGHAGHLVWLPIVLELYLSETADYSLLDARIVTSDEQEQQQTLFQRVCMAMDRLFAARDKYGLNYIAKGDWLASLDGIGYKGGGVSGWLTVATTYALKVWAGICARHSQDTTLASRYAAAADEVNKAAVTHLWDREWFLRGITEDSALIGSPSDSEGRIWLDVQSWAILSGAASPDKVALLLPQVESQLTMPVGLALCAPAFQSARADVGQLTEEPAGSPQNGGSHMLATSWHIYSLYSLGRGDVAFELLHHMSVKAAEKDLSFGQGQSASSGTAHVEHELAQAPKPSYFLGPATASWAYKSIVEGLFGLCADADGLSVSPKLPSGWVEVTAERQFRGAKFIVHINRAAVEQTTVHVDGKLLSTGRITGIQEGRSYEVQVSVPL